jgi:hypothetical protein
MSTPLWAPWRMKYLTGGDEVAGCFMCEGPTEPAKFRERLVIVAQPHAFVNANVALFVSDRELRCG